ncbi:MAG: hypothetical protein HY397_00820 [Candidatus Doudnabacteria bacterium]|nr:hypothetical protein [Candidatus Doudnabacteria bacterium]
MKKVLIITAVALAVLGLLYFYQQQGFVKIFPTRQDREIKKILEIDRSKFQPAEGLTAEQFEAEIKELEKRRQRVLDNPDNADAWFDFGYTKDFLNDHAGAVAAWEKSYELQPLSFLITGNLANTYQYFLRDFVKAEVYYKKTLELKPDLTGAYSGLLDLYRFNLPDKKDQVEPLALQAAENDPANSGHYYSTLVDFFMRDSDIVKAKEYLKKIQFVRPDLVGEILETYPALR